MYKYNFSKNKSKKKIALIVVGVVCLIVAVVAILELTNTTHIFHYETPATQIIKSVGKPTTVPKENASSTAPPTEKTPSSTSSTGDGRIVDTQGQASTQTDQGKWTVSASGNITVKQPSANAKVQNGTVVSGSAKVSTVQYRLIDSKTGVLAQGSLTVVNGNFSGALQFTPASTSGRLDIYSTQPDGTEINEIQISVSF